MNAKVVVENSGNQRRPYKVTCYREDGSTHTVLVKAGLLQSCVDGWLEIRSEDRGKTGQGFGNCHI